MHWLCKASPGDPADTNLPTLQILAARMLLRAMEGKRYIVLPALIVLKHSFYLLY